MEDFAPALHLFTGRTIVIKVGSALIVNADTGDLRRKWLLAIADDIAMLRRAGHQVLVVSSGSIALGRRLLKLPEGSLSLERAQAAAAAGQIALAQVYAEALSGHGLRAAQVLLTLEDTTQRRRYLNGRATLKTLLELGAVPIINENDTVATDEIRYGDNDRLAARVALMASADRLVLLSDVNGLYTTDPNTDPAAKRLDVIREITPEIEAMAREPSSSVGSGGMRTKLLAAKTALQGGCAMVILEGHPLRPLTGLQSGVPCTWFLPTVTPASARKQWIAGLKLEGALIIDEGAAAALQRGKSLLPAGVRGIEGEFERGAAVEIRSPRGGIGVSLVTYSSEEARKLQGHHSTEIETILGYPGRSALAHRDDMVLWD